MTRNPKRPAIIGSSLLAVAAVAAALTILAPASAQSAVKQLISFACFDNQQCIKITNASPTGKAIVGVAQNASAITGQTNINTNTNPLPPNMAFVAQGGVRGVDVSTNPLDTSSGVVGTSRFGSGVVGLTSFDSSINNFGQTGIGGIDDSSTVNSNNGVVGISNHNRGVGGFSPDLINGVGVQGEDDGGVGVAGFGGPTPRGGIGVFGRAGGGNGGAFYSGDPTFAGLIMSNFGGGPITQAFGGSGGGTEVMLLDNAGNLTLAGNLQTGGMPMSITATSVGRKVITYAPQQSVRTVEDVGEAQLVGGQALVRLEPTFASAIDARRLYLVFITPQADTNGLYVSQKTAAGFVVREHNGTSNVAFDFRIVAQPYGPVSPRMPLYTGARDEAAAAAELGALRRHMSNLNRLEMRSPHLLFHH